MSENFIMITKKNGEEKLSTVGPINNDICMRELFDCTDIKWNRHSIDIRNPSTWEDLFKAGRVSDDSGKLLKELSMSKSEIPKEVLAVVYYHGKANGFYKKLDDYMFLCKNLSVLSFLLENGAVFKTRKGVSSMSMWFYPISEQIENFKKFAYLMQAYPNAIDKKYVKKNKARVAYALHEAIVDSVKKKEDSDFFLHCCFNKLLIGLS